MLVLHKTSYVMYVVLNKVLRRYSQDYMYLFTFLFLLKNPEEELCQFPSQHMLRVVSLLCARIHRSMSDALYVTKY